MVKTVILTWQYFQKGGVTQKICCCCGAYLSSCPRTPPDADYWRIRALFHSNDYFVIRGIRTCLRVSTDLMFLWVSSNFCPLTLLLVQSHQAEIIIVKHLITERNNVTRVRAEPPHYAISVVVKATLLPFPPRCRQNLHHWTPNAMKTKIKNVQKTKYLKTSKTR